MSPEQYPDKPEDRSRLLILGVLSLVAGAASGLIGAAFRLTLTRVDLTRGLLIARAHDVGIPGLVLVVAACAGATAVAAWLVRQYAPHATGSGIPHVEAVLNEHLPPAPYRLIPVKFVGGILAIGAGLALGREGPSVQMGAGVAHLVGRIFRRSGSECRILLAAGAGAGLATAFNAPIAGAVFVLEELLRRFDVRVTIATFGASAGAIAVGRWLLGPAPVFTLALLPDPGIESIPLSLALGVFAGALGVVYNRALLGTLAAADRLRRVPIELRAAVVGGGIGLLAWNAPDLVGGGDELTGDALAAKGTLAILPLVFLLRFGLAVVSYATGTPGGLFAPMLVIGAQSGLVIGLLCSIALPGVQPASFAVVGTAAFFTAVVRSPVTGIILVTEMTANTSLLLPMLAACFAAMLVPSLLRDPPIYDSLSERTLRVETGVATAPRQA
jgi:CIC family chloride channel protein